MWLFLGSRNFQQICAQACMHAFFVCVCARACICVCQRTALGIILQMISTFLLKQGLSLAWYLPHRLGWLGTESRDLSVSVSPAVGVQEHYHAYLDVFKWVQGIELRCPGSRNRCSMAALSPQTAL